MVDSGATTKFLHRRFVLENQVATRKLAWPIPLYNIDGTENRDGTISEVAVLDMAIGDHREKVVFVVTDIGEEDVIIGLDWLREHNPEVDWERGSLRLSRCPETCPASQKASKPVETKVRDTEVRLTARQGPRRARKAKTVGRIRAAIMVEEEEEEERPPPPGFLPEWDGTEESFLNALATGWTLRNTPKLFVSATYTYSQQLAEKEYQKKEICPIK